MRGLLFMVLSVLCGGCVLVRYLGCGGCLVFRLGGFLLDDDGAASLVYQSGDYILGRCLGIGGLY